MMSSWCEPPTLEKQSEMKVPKFAEMHNDQQPTCSQKRPRPMQTTMNNKIRIQLVRGMKPITTNKNTMQSSQEQTHSTIKKHTDAGTQRFRPRKWCQNNTTNRSRRNHLRNCPRKKTSRSDYIIDTQTKTQ